MVQFKKDILLNIASAYVARTQDDFRHFLEDSLPHAEGFEEIRNSIIDGYLSDFVEYYNNLNN